MGGGSSITYCVPVTQKPEGESSIYRNPRSKDKLHDRPAPQLATLKDIILHSVRLYGDQPALGNRLLRQELSSTKRTSLPFNS